MNSNSAWQPSENILNLPSNSRFVKERNSVLGCEACLPPESMVERAAIGIWLLQGHISDEHVLVLAGRVLKINLQSDDEIIRPAYNAAAWAWKRLEDLAAGNRVTASVGPTPERQLGLIQEWFKVVMRIVDDLIANGFVDNDELAPLVCDRLADYMRSQWALGAFADAYAIGASLFNEPGLPGGNFGGGDKAVRLALNLATATHTALSDLALACTDIDTVEALDQLVFYWPQLKGYLAAASVKVESGTSLPGLLMDRPGEWMFIRDVCLKADKAMEDPANDELIQRLGWTLSRQGSPYAAIAPMSTRQLVAILDGQIEQARKDSAHRL